MNKIINTEVQFISLGNKDYKETWDYQTQLFEEIVAVKLKNRPLPDEEQELTSNYLLFCEHPHVFTLGKSGDEQHLLVSPEQLKDHDASFYKINRGGDITYHGPGIPSSIWKIFSRIFINICDLWKMQSFLLLRSLELKDIV